MKTIEGSLLSISESISNEIFKGINISFDKTNLQNFLVLNLKRIKVIADHMERFQELKKVILIKTSLKNFN